MPRLPRRVTDVFSSNLKGFSSNLKNSRIKYPNRLASRLPYTKSLEQEQHRVSLPPRTSILSQLFRTACSKRCEHFTREGKHYVAMCSPVRTRGEQPCFSSWIVAWRKAARRPHQLQRRHDAPIQHEASSADPLYLGSWLHAMRHWASGLTSVAIWAFPRR